MQLKTYLTHKNLFFFGLILLVVGMPLSRFLVSVSQLILLGNWLLERNFPEKWRSIKKSKAFWAFTGIYFLYVVGLLWTNDFSYAFKELKVKLPMLWLPLLFFTTKQLDKKKYHVLMHLFVAACIVASLCSMSAYFGILHKKVYDVRAISLFESHIRFSLMIVLSICYLIYNLFHPYLIKQKLLYVIGLLWLLFFIVFLQSFTGLIILCILSILGAIVFLFSNQSFTIKTSFVIILLICFAYTTFLFKDEYQKIYRVNQVDFTHLPKTTINGNAYQNDPKYYFIENGNFSHTSICEKELKNEWNKRSDLSFDGTDNKNNPLSYTLIRYLTSKGLSKDSAGISKLSKEDVSYIENGYANYLYTNPYNIRTRIHELLWETESDIREGDINGHSLTMRFEFWNTAISIIKENVFFGVGTGDVKQAFDTKYREQNSMLNKDFRLRSHNQYLAVTVALGLVGLCVFLLYLYAPFLRGKKLSLLYIAYLLIVWISFINEDTLETQAGVTFCIFFTQLFFQHDEYNL